MTPASQPRARDLGIPFDGEPGALNAITDVAGLTVGHCTVTQGDAMRTGVTALFPLGHEARDGVPAAVFAFNGTGEMTGAHQIAEYGGFFGPLLLTGTLVLLPKLVVYFLYVTLGLPVLGLVSLLTGGLGLRLIDYFDALTEPVERAANGFFNLLHFNKIETQASVFAALFNVSLTLWCVNH